MEETFIIPAKQEKIRYTHRFRVPAPIYVASAMEETFIIPAKQEKHVIIITQHPGEAGKRHFIHIT
jgi:hypothetical protein